MHIGIVAKKIGLTRDAIRFYERSTLLPRPTRTAGGFRQYTENDVGTLEFIRQAQGLGFTLKEVGELLKLRRSRLQPCAPVRRRLERKLVQVRGKLVSLRRLERELKAALRDCHRGVQKRCARCPLLSRHGAQTREATMKIEVLHVAECPGHRVALRLVQDALAAAGITAEIREILVTDERAARELQFRGSPTIRIDGKDVAGDMRQPDTPFGFNCRWYFGSNESGLPPAEMVQRAIAKARQGKKS